ncbi:MAG: ribbon-helix-helix domain-containing protein [Actinomycetota bacterium]|nr:ribbon-helix-helix domain-containing protein [Actinomycetota bacterium]
MTQMISRVSEELIVKVDRLIQEGVVATRSEAIRMGLEQLVETHERERIIRHIAEAYRLTPQTDEELVGIAKSTAALVKEEPW